MAQATTTVDSLAVVPTRPAGQYTRVTDDSILVKVWSAPIACSTSSIFTATPGAGGTISVQISDDNGTNWRTIAGPLAAAATSGVPEGATHIRATAATATGTLVLDTPRTASELSVSELSAIRAMQATYNPAQAQNLAGIPNNIDWLLAALQTNYPRGFVLRQLGGITVTSPNTGLTWTTADNGSGKMRCTASGAHGLTAASNGFYLGGSSTSGLPTALYRMTYVDATNIDLGDVANVTTVSPTFVPVGSPITIFTVTLPGRVMGPNGELTYNLTWQASNNATAKLTRVTFGGSTAVTDLAFNSVVYAEQEVRIENQALYGALAAVQNCSSRSVLAASAIGNVTALAIDTTASVASTVQAQVTAPDEWIKLSMGRCTFFPGL